MWCGLGLRTKQIARTLDIAASTVNEYLASAMKKLDARTRSHAVALLMQSGLAEGSDAGDQR